MRSALLFIFMLAAMVSSASAQSTSLDSAEKLTLSLESVPLVKVLNIIATQNHLNLVLSDQVKGDVSVKLDGVDLPTALNAILTANGYSYFLRDNVIVVKPQDAAGQEELSSRTVVLKYVDPVTAKKALDSRKSAKGQVIILDRTADSKGTEDTYRASRLFISDFPSVVGEMVKLLADMDVPERVVQIEARIIETKLDSQSKLGLTWPTSITTKVTGVDDGSGSSSSGSSTSSTTSTTKNFGALDIGPGRWTWGKLSVEQLTAVLDMLDESGNSKLISDPKITTIENHEALISSATVIPVQTINRFTEGAATQDIVTFQDISVAISLRVTPRINGDGKITLDVEPKVEDIIGYSGTSGNQKPITSSRSVRTNITVADGETVALGGLLKESEIKTVQKFPLLGDVPLLGKLLFTSTSKEKTTTDLVILITPHVLQ